VRRSESLKETTARWQALKQLPFPCLKSRKIPVLSESKALSLSDETNRLVTFGYSFGKLAS
jgi:hypothetical protein